MNLAKHSFVRMTKLADVCGRVDYISNPKRQEHLYATYSTVKPEFWEFLSYQAQHDFKKSNQKNGKCTEARELIIALPEKLQKVEPEILLKIFTEQFRITYGMQCTAALHHNKSKTNYHIHLIFCDREPLEKKEIKIASRNMFYDENGRHVRTKKEILDADGNVREGCRILPKGEAYEVRYFSPRKEEFKSGKFLPEVKKLYTDLINEFLPDEKEKLKVFDPAGPYLPTKKIGKNNPLEAEIKKDNALRQEWNETVDQVLIAGGTQEEVIEFKKKAVTERVAESVAENGYQPGLFAELMVKAIDVLIRFLEFLMGKQNEKEKVQAAEEPAMPAKQKHQKLPDPEKLAKAKIMYLQMERRHNELSRANKKVYAIRKTIDNLKEQLAETPEKLSTRKDRRDLEAKIAVEEMRLKEAKASLQGIPKLYGYDSVKDVEAAYRKAKAIYNKLQRMADGMSVPVVKQEKSSVLMELARNRKVIDEQRVSRKEAEKARGFKAER